MKNIIISTVFLLSALLVFAENAAACTCLLPVNGLSDDEFREQVVNGYNESIYVFSGKVVALDKFVVKFEIDKVYRGEIEKKTFEIPTGAVKYPDGQVMISSCNFTFEVKKSYLVFAQGETPAQARATKCTLTRTIEQSERTIDALEYLVKPDKPVSLLHFKGNFLDNYSFYEPDIY